ncbi:MAG: fumarylacetoacetate hydrolase family protein [Peptococcaceae bacterium]|nr:fumarylacetoacetate hydrolase family protein [Peptococcaceae bacterium]
MEAKIIGRFSKNKELFYGLVEGSRIRIIDSPFSEVLSFSGSCNIEEVNIEVPCEPSKIICLGLNYTDHAKEMGLNTPAEPLIFIKPVSSLLRTGGFIEYPVMSKQVDYEAEMAIIIGRKCRKIEPKDARHYILGCTCANDITARDLQAIDKQWTRAKSFDSFLPLGPYIFTGLDPDNINIRLKLNGEIKQESNTANFIFNTGEIVSYISWVMTLLPGDVILTGTPSGVGSVKKGDRVEVSIDNMPSLVNIVS